MIPKISAQLVVVKAIICDKGCFCPPRVYNIFSKPHGSRSKIKDKIFHKSRWPKRSFKHFTPSVTQSVRSVFQQLDFIPVYIIVHENVSVAYLKILPKVLLSKYIRQLTVSFINWAQLIIPSSWSNSNHRYSNIFWKSKQIFENTPMTTVLSTKHGIVHWRSSSVLCGSKFMTKESVSKHLIYS